MDFSLIQSLDKESAKLASERSQDLILSEHMFYLLLNNPDIKKVFDFLDVDVKEFKNKLKDFLSDPSQCGLEETEIRSLSEIRASEEYEKILKHTVALVQSSGRKQVLATDILYATYMIVQPDDSSFLHHLFENEYSISSYDLKMAITEVIRGETKETEESTEESKKGTTKKFSKPDFIVNLNEKAKEGKIDSLTGRSEEINRMAQILIRRKKNNPVLVGEPGVGKTAIVEGLALKIVNNEVHEKLKDCVIFSLDIGGMLAGAKFRGDFEEKFKMLTHFLKTTPNTILFIDEMHMIMGAGASNESSMDASNMLKPMLANGEIKLIGSTTFKEMKKIDKDTALARRLQKIDIVEPTAEETIKILGTLKSELEKHHGIVYTDEALTSAVNLSVRYINDKFLPDKAIDVLDEAGSYIVLNTKEKEVNKSVIEKVIAKMARMPESSLSTSEKDKMLNLEKNLKLTIYGQDHAIETVTSSVMIAKAGLRKSTKPIANFLFTGPTGTGKTELAKQLAGQLGIHFERIDCSEYDKEHSSEKLIGSPPGYVGHGEGGVLTNAIMKHPHSVVLFDEFEKAHPKFWTYLLQIMDNGMLTDSEGRQVNFRNCIIIMTSNATQKDLTVKRIGMTQETEDQKKQRATNTLNNTFAPEFRGRLDKVIHFNFLNSDNAMLILDKKLLEIEQLLKDKNITCEYSMDAKNWLLKKGYVEGMGARPMENAVEEYVARPLSKEVLFGSLSEKGGVIKVDVKEDKLEFSTNEKKEKKTSKKKVEEKIN